jgi:taurine dioxygenase
MSLDTWEIQPIAGRIGAEIIGIDLSANLSDSLISDIRKALVQYKVIFFRNQTLDENGQLAFSRRFGDLTLSHPTVPRDLPGQTEILDLNYGKHDSYTNNWHTDVTFVDRPPFGSVLRAVVIPPYGGDTVWANTVAAYQDLPPHLKALADQLWVVHSNAFDYAAPNVDLPEATVEYLKAFRTPVYETLHPVVQVHPESGERALLLGGFARRIQGVSLADSADLLRLFQSYVTRLENTIRWRWKEGDVAFWDNRSTQHYAIADYGKQPRRVQRVTIAGEIPISIDGKRSTAVKGDSSSYIPSPTLTPSAVLG